ncbi:NAD(P)-dependent oxidoreductase [Oxalobacteraceae bacterium R-40]|uniref:NAD(P)-dependent oxidoreductase n=1 Tax=Keguizhuia sedimenti TaxID=3064264 RepID=A0ABU1BQV6_9BURK|nr:NAD(P)-dependent oxidoreductase [Oxalobacteraceae bacterium R-40]
MQNNSSLPRIAFLGIGLMGLPMASRLLDAGYPLSAWNRTQAKAEPLAAKGAYVAGEAEDAIRSARGTADIIITMLEAGGAVKHVIQSIIHQLPAGALVIDMSSTKQSEAQELHAMLAEVGVGFIDAPVSGGVIGAEAGTLAIMAGGSTEDFQRAQPVLQHLGRVTLVGPAGCGQIAKLCNQLIVGATLNIVAEALLLAEAGGADPAAMRAAIRGGFAESRILEVHGQRMLDRNFMPGGQIKSQAKDMENILDAAANAHLRLPVTELVTAHYRAILPSFPQADQSAILLAMEQMNPQYRIGNAEDKLP